MQLKPEDVARYYDAWTPRYIAAFGPCIQAHRPTDDDAFLDYLAARIGLAPGMRALDAGCGVCGPARHFAVNTGTLIDAITISPVQVQMAEEATEEAGLTKHIRVMLGDFHDLAAIYPENSFDVVYFLESLSHSAEPARAIRSARDVLKPGGCIYIKDFFIRPCENHEKQREVLEVISRVNDLFEVETAWARDILRFLEEAGLSKIFVEHPRFTVDNLRWQDFERSHEIDLFAGEDSFDWSEWFEMKFQKTNS
jgi:ubiquinone/menaquinone biosynthesis C-methylase UbiE